MEKEEIENRIMLEKLRHKNKMAEIEAERQAFVEVENLKHQNKLSLHRLKRADIRRTLEAKGREYG